MRSTFKPAASRIILGLLFLALAATAQEADKGSRVVLAVVGVLFFSSGCFFLRFRDYGK